MIEAVAQVGNQTSCTDRGGGHRQKLRCTADATTLAPRRTRPFVTIDAEVLAHEDADLLLFGRDPGAGLVTHGLARARQWRHPYSLDGIDARHGPAPGLG